MPQAHTVPELALFGVLFDGRERFCGGNLVLGGSAFGDFVHIVDDTERRGLTKCNYAPPSSLR